MNILPNLCSIVAYGFLVSESECADVGDTKIPTISSSTRACALLARLFRSATLKGRFLSFASFGLLYFLFSILFSAEWFVRTNHARLRERERAKTAAGKTQRTNRPPCVADRKRRASIRAQGRVDELTVGILNTRTLAYRDKDSIGNNATHVVQICSEACCGRIRLEKPRVTELFTISTMKRSRHVCESDCFSPS